MKIEIKVTFSATVPHMPAFSDFNYCINTFILPIVSAEDGLFSLSPNTTRFPPPGSQPSLAWTLDILKHWIWHIHLGGWHQLSNFMFTCQGYRNGLSRVLGKLTLLPHPSSPTPHPSLLFSDTSRLTDFKFLVISGQKKKKDLSTPFSSPIKHTVKINPFCHFTLLARMFNGCQGS